MIGSSNKMFALGRLKTGERNKTEQAYENLLEAMRISGDVLWYKFEGMKLRLADNTFYTPDFAVMLSSGQIEMHEVKGFWQDDARVKIKGINRCYMLYYSNYIFPSLLITTKKVLNKILKSPQKDSLL